MFLFTSDIGQTDLEGMFAATRALGTWKLRARGSTVLAWLETPFCRVRERRGDITVHIARPTERVPVCAVNWDLDAELVTISRQWSGEFRVLVARRPVTVIASHLRLASAACGGLRFAMRSVDPGGILRLNLRKPLRGTWKSSESFRAPYRLSYADTVNEVRKLIYDAVRKLPPSSGLLLSGGLDSSIIAAVARDLGRALPAFTFSVNKAIRDQPEHERDLRYARLVAKHLHIPLTEILLTPARIIGNVPLAVLLAETSRGTIVDPSTALIEVAKQMSRAGLSSVILGEAADDLFGSFTFVLRYKKGRELRSYYRHELDVGLPDEIAVLQRVFEPWGIALVDPYWTRKLKIMGYNIPLDYRVDPQRAMKRILRDAFQDLLPEEIIRRPKVVTRNGSLVRFALESRFGISPHRYRPIFRKIFVEGGSWLSSALPPKILNPSGN